MKEIALVVGHNDELPSNTKHATHTASKSWLDKTSSMVLALRPRVREVHVHSQKALRRKACGKHTLRLSVQNADVLQPCTTNTVGRIPAVCASVFNTQEIQFRPGSRSGQQEGPFACADLYLHWPPIAKDSRKVQRASSC